MTIPFLADRPAGTPLGLRGRVWPAWLTSVVAHACLLATFLWLLSDRTPRGVEGESLRQAGIVLKRMTADGPQFEDAPESVGDADNEATLAPVVTALPAADEIPDAASGLPPLAAPTPGASGSEGLGSASAMATGGSPPPRKSGGKARVSVFGVTGEGTRFVYAFDRSVSMEGPPLAAAKAQLIASLDSLESVHQFQILFFNHQLQAWDLTGGQQRLAFASDQNKRLAENFVRGVTATGGTVRKAPLLRALALQPDALFFLTDADDQMPDRDIDDAIARARRSGTAIQVIEFGVGPAAHRENFLTRLARETGGQHTYVDTTRLGR